MDAQVWKCYILSQDCDKVGHYYYYYYYYYYYCVLPAPDRNAKKQLIKKCYGRASERVGPCIHDNELLDSVKCKEFS